MQNTQELLHKFSNLSEKAQINLLEYLETLWEQEKESFSKKKRGALGSWKGKIKISDDFDAPLDDFKEYM